MISRLVQPRKLNSVVLAEGRHKDQRNRKENPERKPHKYNQLIFDKDVKAIQWKKIVFSTNRARATRYPQTKKKKNFKLHFTLYTKINSKLIINLNV